MAIHDPRHAAAAAVHVVARHWARPDTIGFANEAALAEHAAAPYIAGLQARLRGLTARPSEVCRYRAV